MRKRLSFLKRSSFLLLAAMSSAETVATGSYTRKAIAIAEAHEETVIGFICLRKLSKNPGMIYFTLDVKLEPGQDSLGQRYRTIDEILIKNRSDIIIVGRDITHAAAPRNQATLYREKGWEAYAKTLT